MNEAYDIIIVGGGSAGCVLASRLSEDSGRSVLLIEAGSAYPPDGYPKDLTNGSVASIEPFRTWGYASVPGRTGHVIGAPAGRVLGGGSAINGAISRRGRPSDFARWVAHGLPEWSFDRVLEAYKALENTPDGEDRWHGRFGPWPIRQTLPEQLTPPVRAFVEAAAGLGFVRIEDMNDPEHRGGVGGEAKNLIDDVRQNVGMVYLTAEVRARPNVTIRPETMVDRILFFGRKAEAVLLANGEKVQAAEIILAAGVYGSPAILLRSGIGPATHLRSRDIDVVADLPVGERLRDQPMITLSYVLKPDALAKPPGGSGILWTASSEAADGELDLQLSISVQPDIDAAGAPIRTLRVWAAVVLPRSTGTVRLKSTDPHVTPRIDYDLLSQETDGRRLREIVLLARRIMTCEPVASLVVEDETPDAPVSSEAEPDATIRAGLMTFLHGVGTAPMGGPDDPDAVVDRWGRIHGVDGVRVADASIFPEPVSVPVNLTILMIAERIATAMRDQSGATAAETVRDA